MLAAALNKAAELSLDPDGPSFEDSAVRAMSSVMRDAKQRDVFFQSLDEQWIEEDKTAPVSYPAQPGPLVLAEQANYEDDLDTIEPTGWTAGTAKRQTVMIVDDSEAYRTLLKSQLETEGYCVLLAQDGWEALGQLADVDIDLMLVDVMMPRMTGIELVDIVHRRAELRDLPVVMITAADVSEWRSRAAAVGATLLSKPLKKAVLLHEIQMNIHTPV